MTRAELSRFMETAGLLSPRDPDVANIVDLAGTIAGWLGGMAFASAGAKSGGSLPAAGAGRPPRIDRLSQHLSRVRGIVFVIADGLGVEQIEKSAPGGFLKGAMRSELRSVYPSTTATALTSLASARWAGIHGVTGWWTHIPRLARTLCAVSFSERGTNADAGALRIDMGEIVPVGSMYQTDLVAVSSLLPQYIADSPFARWTRGETPIAPYRSLAHAFRQATRRARATDGPFLLSVYLPHVDSTIHKRGTDHAETHAVIGELDRRLDHLASRVPADVAVVLTADHGLVDLDRTLHEVIEDGHPLLDGLLLPPTGEGTNPVFHVRDGAEQKVREALDRSEAGAAFRLVPTDLLAGAGFFGPDGIDPEVRERFGTHIGVAERPALLEYVPAGRESIRHRGIHGGLRAGEMRVPLCVAGG
ncbi:MAG: alkaline phosphatase family protein [Spirochaetia bacterium]